VSGLALRSRQVAWTDDYLADERFAHTPERDQFVREAGVRSVISAPLVRDDEVLGVITVYADPAGAFGPGDATLLEALADQGAVTIMNARLIEELQRSREEVARRADSERTLREIAARVSAILDPGEVLQRIVDEAARLLGIDPRNLSYYMRKHDLAADHLDAAGADASIRITVSRGPYRTRGVLPPDEGAAATALRISCVTLNSIGRP